MNDGTYESAMRKAGLLAELLVNNMEQLRFVQNTLVRVHSVAPILDPTAYRRGMGNLDDAAELVGPLLAAASALEPVLDKIRSHRREW